MLFLVCPDISRYLYRIPEVKNPCYGGAKCGMLAIVFSSLIVALSLGVVLGNVLIGLPIDKAGNYMGSTFDFLNPYALMVGIYHTWLCL
jgi:cytochrome d ubiquinol oxidase subunit II